MASGLQSDKGMANGRFHRKTENISITATLGVVVVLLLLSASCSREKKEVVEVAFNPDSTYTMRTTDVTSLISDSGVTRYKIETPEWLMYDEAAEPYWYFPQGGYLEKFDSLFQAEAMLKADTIYRYTKKELWKLVGNVEIKNLKGEFFETSLLYWDEKAEKFYSDKFIRIKQKEQTITGIGFESNNDMSRYVIFKTGGEFPVEETPKDSTQVETKE